MNGPAFPGAVALADVQAQADERNLPIEAVGVSGVRFPLTLAGPGGRPIPTVATFAMTVALPARAKGTHMSRFIEVLEELGPELHAAEDLVAMARRVRARLAASEAAVEMRFPYFVRKTAPVSGVASLLDCDVTWRAEARPGGEHELAMEVATPVTSLCPCSKEISDYGAHNQRSSVRIDIRLATAMRVEELVAIAERAASCEVYGLLKRPDEKYVTEKAYDNPKFVEDLVRDVALALAREPRVLAYKVEAENFESIHNHSAFARIRSATR